MRIYLACTVRGDRGGVVAGRTICERLERQGHEALTKHLLADDVDAAESTLTEQRVFSRDLGWLTNCDVLARRRTSGSAAAASLNVKVFLSLAPGIVSQNPTEESTP